jgi:TPR repeat protein
MMNGIVRSFTAMVLTAIMMGNAAAGLTLESEPDRSFCEHYEAAVRSDPDAQAGLAAMYAEGAGVPQSDAYAFQWFMRAAGQGHAQAQLRLSEMFVAGRGAPKNRVAAYKWAALAKAAARKPETTAGAARMFAVLAPLMSEAQIAEARSLASDWRPAPELRRPHDAQPREKTCSRPAGLNRLTAR